ncbi:MAG: hypothetical protein DDT25_00421 [Chloroflexi bacterium]|nr:hypothetical protein [Chloroflexota bacterium]
MRPTARGIGEARGSDRQGVAFALSLTYYQRSKVEGLPLFGTAWVQVKLMFYAIIIRDRLTIMAKG